MIAVSDTSPICYLVLIGEIELLSKLFSQVLVPRAVLAELLHGDAPDSVRNWASNPPSWISVQESLISGTAMPGIQKLQAGEQAAILLARSVSADMILVDEKSARRVATEAGLRITGTLGVLGEAAERELVNLTVVVDQLRKTNFRYSPALLKAVLDRRAWPT